METYNDHLGGLTQDPSAPSAPRAAPESGEISIVDLLIILAERKKMLFWVPLAAALVAVGISLSLPNVYVATTKLLPPQQAQSGASALLAQLGGAAGMAGGIAGVKNPGEIYLGMLKSRTIADNLVAKFDLKRRYQLASPERARGRLAENTVVSSGKDGLITVSVEDTDQKLVAGLANGYVSELHQLTKTLAVTEASQRRLFFERQLESAKDNLAKVEVSLKGAMDSGGVISVDSESLAILQTAARLRAQVSTKEIQLGSMRPFVTDQNPEYRRAVEELRSLRSELAKLEGGRAVSAPTGGDKRGGLDNIQLMRDLKYYQMLYELLAKQYEVARLDEAKEAPQIQVLDAAVEPEFKAKPKRALIVLASTIVAFFAAVVWALLAAAKKHAMTVPADAARWNKLSAKLRFRQPR